MKSTLIAVAAAAVVVGQAGIAAEDGTGSGAGRKFHHSQRKETAEHQKQQHQENREFRKDLRGTSGSNRVESVVQQRETQYQENVAFRQEQHEQNMAYLKERLASNTKLTDAEKDELTNFFEQQYTENVAFRDQQHTANIAEFEKIAGDTSMTQEQKKQAIRDYFAAQKTGTKTHIQEQRQERKDQVKAAREAAASTDARK